jgi:uncharacterized protein YacL
VDNSNLGDVARAIQMSLAPVFLLSGISVLLGVLTARLARVVDRARGLEARLSLATSVDAADLHQQLRTLAKRARLMNWSITLGTIAALLIALVVAVLFAAALYAFSAAEPVAFLFISAMAALIVTLILFLSEVTLATQTIRIGPHP